MTPHAAAAHPEDVYIASVLAHVPFIASLRAHIDMDLRSHIAERTEQGQPLDEVFRQLGDPEKLAESYLHAVPLVAATFGERAGAKVIDVIAVYAGSAVLCLGVGAVLLTTAYREAWYFALPVSFLLAAIGFLVYTVYAEYSTGQTLGKRLIGLRVVRESGAHISLGQAVVRILPMFFQFFWVDVLFALFTDKNQRAFEIISKTRVVKSAAER